MSRNNVSPISILCFLLMLQICGGAHMKINPSGASSIEGEEQVEVLAVFNVSLRYELRR